MNKSVGYGPEPDSFGYFLRQLRERGGLPLREVAAAVEMDQAHLSKAELGQRLPTVAQTEALARFFRQDPVEWEARRITQKFRQDHAGNPAAARAVLMLQGGRNSGQLKSASMEERPEVPPDNSVMILHAD